MKTLKTLLALLFLTTITLSKRKHKEKTRKPHHHPGISERFTHTDERIIEDIKKGNKEKYHFKDVNVIAHNFYQDQNQFVMHQIHQDKHHGKHVDDEREEIWRKGQIVEEYVEWECKTYGDKYHFITKEQLIDFL